MLDRIPDVNWFRVVRLHKTNQSIDQVGHVLEGSGVLAIAIYLRIYTININYLIKPLLITVIGCPWRAWRTKLDTTRPSFMCIRGP